MYLIGEVKLPKARRFTAPPSLLFYNISPLLTPAQQIVPADWTGILRKPVAAGPQTNIQQRHVWSRTQPMD